MKTIEDVRNRKVAVHNNGTLEQLVEVLGIAFPSIEKGVSGLYEYYFAQSHDLHKWNYSNEKPNMPIQSVKDFLVKEEFKLPEKWCVLGDKQEVIDYSNIYGVSKPYEIVGHHYHHYPPYEFDDLNGTSSTDIEEGYTEITFGQFKKYVLKEELGKTKSSEDGLYHSVQLGQSNDIGSVSVKEKTDKQIYVDSKMEIILKEHECCDKLSKCREVIECIYDEITLKKWNAFIVTESKDKHLLVKEGFEAIKEDKMNNKQEYELVDFKIEDLKGGETLVSEDSEFKIEGFVGNICFLTFEGVIIIYTREELKNKGLKLQVPKPKLEKIQGFEVREYPELPLVEVSDDDDFPERGTYIVKLLKVMKEDHPFKSTNNRWKFCRPVQKEKRNFIDIEEE